MARIGNWWLKGVEAEPEEQVVWSKLANRTQSANRAVGGKLFLTDRRLVFCPHWIDAMFAGRTWDVPLSAITRASVAPKGGGGLGGGMRDRLRIELAEGGEQLFVINALAEVVERVNQAVGPASPAPDRPPAAQDPAPPPNAEQS
jgi:hypothetical protein